MTKKTDRRIRKTKAQLRQGLAELLQEKSLKEITVKELTDKVDINRSTFYLHYSDIYDMMEKIENELIEEIEELVRTRPVNPFNESSFPFIEEIFTILAENRQICAALLGPQRRHCLSPEDRKYPFPHSLKVLRKPSPEKSRISSISTPSSPLLCGYDQNVADRPLRGKSPIYGPSYLSSDHECPSQKLIQTSTPERATIFSPARCWNRGNNPSHTDNCQYCSDPYSHQTSCKYQTQENGHSNIKKIKTVLCKPYIFMNTVSDSLDNAVSGVWHDPHRKGHRGAHSSKDDRQDQYQQPKRQVLDPLCSL